MERYSASGRDSDTSDNEVNGKDEKHKSNVRLRCRLITDCDTSSAGSTVESDSHQIENEDLSNSQKERVQSQIQRHRKSRLSRKKHNRPRRRILENPSSSDSDVDFKSGDEKRASKIFPSSSNLSNSNSKMKTVFKEESGHCAHGMERNGCFSQSLNKFKQEHELATLPRAQVKMTLL